MKSSSLFAVFLVIFSIAILQSTALISHERRLVEHLFQNYNPMVRPVKNSKQPLNITIAMFLEVVKDVNERDSSITISGWLEIEWKDDNLCWNATDFGNMTFLLAKAEKIWRPDCAFNSVVGDRVFHTEDAVAGITNDCNVAFAPGGETIHSCDYDVKFFPFDTQTCSFVVAAWFSSVNYVHLLPLNFMYNVSRSNELWEIVGNTSERRFISEHSPGHIVFTLTLKRKPLYYIIYMIIPLLMLAFLNVMVFRLPPAAGGKVKLSITILLASAVWQTMLNDLTPRSSDSIPILGMFITALMILSVLSTALCVYIVRIHKFDNSRPIPLLVQHFTRLFDKGSYGKNGNKNSDPPAAVSWTSVSLALDNLAFGVVSFLTLVLIVACIVSFFVLQDKDSN